MFLIVFLKPRKSTLLVKILIDFVGRAICIILVESIYLDALILLIIDVLIWHFYNPPLSMKNSYWTGKIALLKDMGRETPQHCVC